MGLIKKMGIGICASALAFSVWAGIRTGKAIGSAESELMNYSAYQSVKTLEHAVSDLYSASSHLNYSPSRTETSISIDADGNPHTNIKHIPESLPDPGYSREQLTDAVVNISKISTNEEGNFTDYEKVSNELMEIKNMLPDENNLRYYDGIHVTNSTFQWHRDSIGKISGKLEIQKDRFFSLVPKDLMKKKNENILGLVGSIMLGLFALGAGGYLAYREITD